MIKLIWIEYTRQFKANPSYQINIFFALLFQ